ncbi:MAG: hydrogenase formation protein HypD [Methylococcaceae bacterium]|jgi:hydrogenase expression/formation protein HypD
MKYVDEYRDPARVRQLSDQLAQLCRRPWTLMEVCGGQTHAILKYGIDRLLPAGLELIHGPGCPVCVTPASSLDQAITLAARADTVVCSYGDMLRVPGSHGDLLTARAAGGGVRVVYSPLEALEIARQHPNREVVFFAVGFETTAPATAMAVFQARQEGLTNFSLLVSHVRVPPAMTALLASPECRIQGFLAAGHVCAVMGSIEYQVIVDRYRVPVVVTGFEPVDMLNGIMACVRQLEAGRHEVENQYRRVVRPDGNQVAQRLMAEVFRSVDREWRGLGTLPASGWGLSEAYAAFDAERRFDLPAAATPEPAECLGGKVLQGLIRPDQCPAFGSRCTPINPLGATMVSSEGACAAYFRYRPPAAPMSQGGMNP